ncbi:unnamed protein product [Owenia fusiformis]|uniref:BRF2-like C-terminal domain-containing protein n=1 Tax=Owenia fusiformis TaxID=6347 RepID=A0A8S4Q9J5_OWEFU|nr:unnamed protein product [Owenia fusiformis]
MDLYHLCQNCWLTTGHNHERILLYLTFIAWVAESFGKRRKTSWGQFTKLFEVSNTKANDKQKSILKYLVEMASNIPWIDMSDFKHDKDVLAHLNDILKYRNLLVNEITMEMTKIRDNIDEKDVAEVDNFKDGDPNKDKFPQVGDGIKNEKQINNNTTPDMEQKFETGRCVSHKNNDVAYDRNEKKYSRRFKRERRDWTVPKVKSHKRIADESDNIIIEHPDLDCEDLTEHDIPDEDVEKYVKSEHEVKRLKLFDAQSEFDN